MRRLSIQVIAALAYTIAAPAFGYAQASIAGTVSDPSGAALPGVAVEVTGPSLIEKTRSVVSDSTGRYRIVELPPGDYSLSFALSGFRSVKRDAIELTGSFTATVDVTLPVGPVTETVTVTVPSPVVDVQSAQRQVVLDADIVKSIPAARTFYGLAQLTPGITLVGTTPGAGGGSLAPIVVQMAAYGGPVTEGVVQVNGNQVRIGLGGGSSYHQLDIGNAQEVDISVSGRLGEAESAAPTLNLIPKTGGNHFAGGFYTNFATESWASRNVTPELAALGIKEGVYPLKLWDVDPTVGGPIVKDRVWFFAGYRNQGMRQPVPGLFTNANAGDPAKWTYLSSGESAKDDGSWTSENLRLTWQASPRNNFQFAWDRQYACTSCIYGGSVSATGVTSPEAASNNGGNPQHVQEVSWRSPVTSRLLLEGGFSDYLITFGFLPDRGRAVQDLVRVTDQCTTGCPAQGGFSNTLNYRSLNWGDNFSGTYSWRASAAYITGTHNIKVGYLGNVYTWESQTLVNSQQLSYRFNNAVPNQLTEQGNHGVRSVNDVRTAAVYAQDQWTVRRLTLQGAVRYDRATSWYPEQTIGPNRFFPNAATIPGGTSVAGFNDVTPRVGAAYDLFGNGKTSLKASLGRYVAQAQASGIYTQSNPISGNQVPLSVTRTWTDANRNFTPDCNLLNPLQQDNQAAGGDFCGQISNLAFGTIVPTSAVVDPDVLSGWHSRPWDWNLSVGVQQEIFPRASVEVAYVRRTFSGLTVVDNLATTAADYTPFSVVTPDGAPGGSGLVVGGLYNVVPAVQSTVQNLTIGSGKYAAQLGVDDLYDHFNGVDVNFKFRLRNGLAFQGGTSSGQQVGDACGLRSKTPEVTASSAGVGGSGLGVGVANPYCHVTTGLTTQVRGLATYVVPKADVQVSGTFRSDPGFPLQANYTVTCTAQSNAACVGLGRALSGASTNVTIPLLQPFSMRGDRVTQIDFHVSKIFRAGGKRINVGADMFNVLNRSDVQGYSNAFVVGQTWPVPSAVMPARYVKASFQIDF